MVSVMHKHAVSDDINIIPLSLPHTYNEPSSDADIN